MAYQCVRTFSWLDHYHVIAHVDRHVLPPVVDRDRVSDHLRHDRRPPGPRPNHALFPRLVEHPDLVQQGRVDKRAFLDRPAHTPSAPSPDAAPSCRPRCAWLISPLHDEVVARLRLPGLVSQGRLPPRG